MHIYTQAFIDWFSDLKDKSDKTFIKVGPALRTFPTLASIFFIYSL